MQNHKNNYTQNPCGSHLTSTRTCVQSSFHCACICIWVRRLRSGNCARTHNMADKRLYLHLCTQGFVIWNNTGKLHGWHLTWKHTGCNTHKFGVCWQTMTKYTCTQSLSGSHLAWSSTMQNHKNDFMYNPCGSHLASTWTCGGLFFSLCMHPVFGWHLACFASPGFWKKRVGNVSS